MPGEHPLPRPGQMVKMHNTLARATWPQGGQYDLDLVMHIAAKIRADDNEFTTYRFPVTELGYGKKLDGRTYRLMKESLKRLSKSSVLLEGENGSFFFYSLFSMAGYENGDVVARFGPGMRPYFLHLTKHFTSFELREMRMLPSGYSKRMFLLLKSFSSLPERTIPLSGLHRRLLVPVSFESDFAQFRRWVLDKAQKDLRAILPFEWEAVKQGRAVVAVRFVFSGGKKALVAGKKAVVLRQRDTKRQTSESRRRNELVLAAVGCAKDRTPPCRGDAGKPDVCKICHYLDILQA